MGMATKGKPDNNAMALTAHLGELRQRLIVCVVAIGAGFAVCYAYSEGLYALLAEPLMSALPQGSDYFVFTGITEPFFIYMKVGFFGGVILASPVIFYEIWDFAAPGLYRHEKVWLGALVAASVLFFVSGVAFAYKVVFPFGFKYLIGYSTYGLRPMLSMDAYFSMAAKLLIAFGMVFELPLAMLMLARLGIVTAGKLLGWWRYAIVAILLASGILTPTPDVFNQLLMAGPLIVLYGMGIVAARLFGKKREAPEAEGALETR
jgi:sec-independent protein translocase protein TatC